MYVGSQKKALLEHPVAPLGLCWGLCASLQPSWTPFPEALGAQKSRSHSETHVLPGLGGTAGDGTGRDPTQSAQGLRPGSALGSPVVPAVAPLCPGVSSGRPAMYVGTYPPVGLEESLLAPPVAALGTYVRTYVRTYVGRYTHSFFYELWHAGLKTLCNH